MRDEDFVRRGGKVQCTWKTSLLCTLRLMMQYTCDCYCFWCVCESTPVSQDTSFFYSSGTVLFRILFSSVPCCAGAGVETVLCWHGMARFERGSVAFTLVFRSVLCLTEPCRHGFTCQCKWGIRQIIFDSHALMYFVLQHGCRTTPRHAIIIRYNYCIQVVVFSPPSCVQVYIS